MKKFKRASKLFLVAAMVASFTLSVAACDTSDEGDNTGDNGTNQTTPTDPSNPNPNPENPSNPSDPTPGTTVEHTVKFVTNCSATINDKKVKDGESFTVEDPTNGTSVFLGWYTNSNLNEQYKYTLGTPVKGDITLYAKWKEPTVNPNPPGGGDDPVVPVTKYTVNFDTNSGNSIASQSVEEGKKAFKPANPEKAGNQFKGWLLNGNPFSFDNVITGDITLVASWGPLDAKIQAYGAYNESLYVEWSDGAPSQATVQYKLKGESTWQDVDKELVRAKSGSNGVARVDVLGITAGDYDIKIQPSGGASPLELSDIAVAAYDRSGYAHFKYTEGVGAYNDDGTLKDNAIVIYVTDENKDYVMRDIVAKYSGVNMFKVPGNDWGNKDAESIGWWLNNAQYTKTDKSGNKGNTWVSNGNSLGFKSVDKPIAIRFLGKVTTPEGCTAYNSLNEGGSVGDNGHMARMRNLKNITIEGVGEDAVIEGWGFHFMTGSDAVNGQGKSFEVRNLTFDKYPEDAIGMEGVQEGGKITGSVERCWIHHNTFLPGYCAKPAESDKAEGDGSCDFKRGEYFTCSYNYFTDCHKTNLVGSSDSSLQYNLTYHHNWWHNCGSRIPLTRQANVHFYNNYISTDTTTSAKISYVHSIRANAYIFSEANYYFGCKNIADDVAKGWNNVYLGCFGENKMVEAKSREQTVANSCTHFNKTNLSSFDTDPNLFYYNAQTKQSDCLLDDAVTARAKALQYAGCNGWGNNNPKKNVSDATGAVRAPMNEQTPSEAVPVPDEGTLTVDFKAPPKGVLLDGSVSSGSLKSTKGKGQFVTFRLMAPAKVTIGGVSDSYSGPYLVSQDGTVIAQLPGTVSVELNAGIYMICVSNYSYDMKQSSISSLSFEATANSAKAKLEAVDQAITAIGEVTLSSGNAIENAKSLLNSLKAEEKTLFESTYPGQIEVLNNAIAKLSELQIENVKTLISAIGEVGENSYPSIKSARDAYNALTTEQKASVSNYGVLTQAENDWANVAVVSINKQIGNLPDVSGWTTANGKDNITNAKNQYETVKSAYEALTSTQQGQVSNYGTVTNGLTKLNALLAEIAQAEQEAQNLANFNAKLNALTAETVTLQTGADLKAAYEKLTPAQQATIDKAKYDTIIEAYNKLANQAVKCTFIGGQPSNSAFAHTGSKKSAKNTAFTVNAYGGELASGLKLESSTELTFTTTTKMTLKLYVDANSKKIKVNGSNVTSASENGDFVATITLEAGTHTIAKADSVNLYFATLTPAS